MDELVIAAMKRWPNVPDCYGWLGLDDRGRWRLRDDATQQAGSFQDGPEKAQGSILNHEKLKEFISRNYTHDEQGRWYFQNGPQKVFVELKNAPLVLRIHENGQIVTHTNKSINSVKSCLTNDSEKLFLDTDLGLGLAHSLDMLQACEYIEKNGLVLEQTSNNMAEQFHYIKSPQAHARLK